eukprot:1187103-Prorocentrum_minimum.AAC.1
MSSWRWGYTDGRGDSPTGGGIHLAVGFGLDGDELVEVVADAHRGLRFTSWLASGLTVTSSLKSSQMHTAFVDVRGSGVDVRG